VRRRLVRNTVLVAVMVLMVLATPVVLLLKQATEDELTSRLSGTAAAISGSAFSFCFDFKYAVASANRFAAVGDVFTAFSNSVTASAACPFSSSNTPIRSRAPGFSGNCL